MDSLIEYSVAFQNALIPETCTIALHSKNPGEVITASPILRDLFFLLLHTHSYQLFKYRPRNPEAINKNPGMKFLFQALTITSTLSQ